MMVLEFDIIAGFIESTWNVRESETLECRGILRHTTTNIPVRGFALSMVTDAQASGRWVKIIPERTNNIIRRFRSGMLLLFHSVPSSPLNARYPFEADATEVTISVKTKVKWQ